MPPATKNKPKSFADLPGTSSPPSSTGTPTMEPGAMVTRQMETVAIDDIVDDGHNHRIPGKADAAKLQGLARSIEANGILQPPMLYRGAGGRLHRVYGSRRIAAAKLNGWAKVTAIVLPSIPTDAELHRYRAEENLRRENLNAAEEALAVFELVEAHRPIAGEQGAIDKAAGDMGQDAAWVRDRLYIVGRLSEKTRGYLAAGGINLSHARELAKLGEQLQDRFAKQISDALEFRGTNHGGHLVNVEELRNWIANEKHNLRVVGWKLEVPFAGKPACIGCPYNSTTDLQLFETNAKDVEKGHCHNPSCYDLKLRKVGEAQTKAVDKIRDQVKAKRVDKADAGSIELVRNVVADFVKPEAVQRKARSEFGSPAPKAAAGGKGAGKKEEVKKPLTEKERRQEALLKWGIAYAQYWQKCEDKLRKVSAEPMLFLGLYALECSEHIQKCRFYDIPSYEYAIRNGEFKNRVSPIPETPIPPKLSRMLDCIKARTPEGLIEVAATNVGRQNQRLMPGPELANRILDVFGVSGVPATSPAFEDFLPDDLKPKGSPTVKRVGGDSTIALAKAAVDGDNDAALRAALYAMAGSLLRWLKAIEDGATDDGILEMIKNEWEGNPTASGNSERPGYATRGGAKPAIWIGTGSITSTKGKPTFAGDGLVDAVRGLLGIPEPGEGAANVDDDFEGSAGADDGFGEDGE